LFQIVCWPGQQITSAGRSSERAYKERLNSAALRSVQSLHRVSNFGGFVMPVAPTYPGVYIEEIPSGVRTITGVATSITAFVGRALRGPVNEPMTINNFGDFERIFGGLWVQSSLGYAVRDFYLNGG